METSGIMPVMDMAGNHSDGFGYGGGAWFMWIVVLFFLMGGNGWGNNRNAATTNDVYAAVDNQNLTSSIRDIARQINQVGDGISSATFALNNTINNGFTGVMRDGFTLQQGMMGGFANVAQAINENRFTAQSCCCETNRNIDSVRYENAMNTNAIVKAICDDGEKTRALITQNTMQDLRDKLADRDRDLQSARFAYSQQAQNNYLIEKLKTTTA